MLQFKIKRLWEPDNDDNDLNDTSFGGPELQAEGVCGNDSHSVCVLITKYMC